MQYIYIWQRTHKQKQINSIKHNHITQTYTQQQIKNTNAKTTQQQQRNIYIYIYTNTCIKQHHNNKTQHNTKPIQHTSHTNTTQ